MLLCHLSCLLGKMLKVVVEAAILNQLREHVSEACTLILVNLAHVLENYLHTPVVTGFQCQRQR